jgi:hypothetical protein
MDAPGLSTVQRYALVQRAFMTFKGTRLLYTAHGLKPPFFLALTYLGRIKQFYRRTGRKFPWGG